MSINWTTTLQPKVIRRRQVHLQGLPSQRRFLHCRAGKKGFSGPVGSGKTVALCYQGLLSAERNPNCVGLIGAPTYPMLRDVTIPASILQTADHQALLRDLTASWHPESTVVDRRQHHRIPCEIAAFLVQMDDQDQTVRSDPLAVLIANLSKCGIGIVHRHPLPHRLALIEYELASGNLVQLMVRLKWCRFKGADFYESGGQIQSVLQNPIRFQGTASAVAP